MEERKTVRKRERYIYRDKESERDMETKKESE